MFKSTSLIKRILLLLVVILSLGFLSLTIFSTNYAQSIIIDKVNSQLEKRLSSIQDTMVVYDDTLKSMADELYKVFSIQFGDINIDNSQTINVNGVETPLMTNNGKTINLDFNLVDGYTKIPGSTATVFAKMGDDFVRVTTSLKRPNGTRTLGTFLGKKSPAYKKILNKEKYFGTAHLFGSDYMAVYNPIIKNGEVIGILYIGFNYTNSYNKLVKRLKSIKIGDTGYIYILSTKPKTKGDLILHPSLEGKNLIKIAQEKGNDFTKEMFENKSGTISYIWSGTNKSVVFGDYADRNWKIVLGANSDEFLSESLELKYLTIFLSLIMIVLVSVILYFMIRTVVIKPLHGLQDGLDEFFEFLNGKKDSTTLIKVDSLDEIGQMSTLVNNSIQEIEHNINIDNELISETVEVANNVSNGHLDNRITQDSNNPKLNELKDVVNQMLENINTKINTVQTVLSSYTQFDYRVKVDDSGVDAQLKELYNSVNDLGAAISHMLVENKSNGLTLDLSSNILLKNVDVLNQNSTISASSLEETAGALEEITSNISNNTKNIVIMSQCANELTESSQEGKTLATKTTTAMDEINTEVNSISDAISVIDQISFQTNILSLNAAVEAATAGEAGKGFAVVAQEVRNLAARSADAANEIKLLVENATSKANQGKTIADKMIEGYTGLNDNISKTIDLISGVEVASKEQLKGIEQINETVSSLDRQTQENANIASQTHDEAIQTDKIAKLIVSNANSKEFIGKEEAKAKIL